MFSMNRAVNWATERRMRIRPNSIESRGSSVGTKGAVGAGWHLQKAGSGGERQSSHVLMQARTPETSGKESKS